MKTTRRKYIILRKNNYKLIYKKFWNIKYNISCRLGNTKLIKYIIWIRSQIQTALLLYKFTSATIVKLLYMRECKVNEALMWFYDKCVRLNIENTHRSASNYLTNDVAVLIKIFHTHKSVSRTDEVQLLTQLWRGSSGGLSVLTWLIFNPLKGWYAHIHSKYARRLCSSSLCNVNCNKNVTQMSIHRQIIIKTQKI